MPEHEMPLNGKYEVLERISTEELKRILQEDLDAPVKNDLANDEFITAVMEVIAKRENKGGAVPEFDVESGWADFQKNYYPTEDDPILLLSEEEQRLYAPENFAHSDEHEITPSCSPLDQKKGHRKPVLRRIGLVAAVIFVVAGLLIGAQAAGIDVFGAVAHWTNEVFHFTRPTVNGEVRALQDALEAQGLPRELAPTWIPEGYAAEEPAVQKNRTALSVDACFVNGEDSFCISISRWYLPDRMAETIYEKDEEEIEKFTSNGRTFYIFSNIDVTTATWTDGEELSIDISGNISTDDMKKTINSIGGNP